MRLLAHQYQVHHMVTIMVVICDTAKIIEYVSMMTPKSLAFTAMIPVLTLSLLQALCLPTLPLIHPFPSGSAFFNL